jgi:hypothetical protein
MGLIHSRASKKRAKAEARLAREQRKVLRQSRKNADAAVEQQQREHREDEAQNLAWYRQPTVGAAIRRARRDHPGS